MCAFPFGNDPAKIEGYRKFWNRSPAARPLVGFSYKSWFPLDEFSASSGWKQDSVLSPRMVRPREFLDDQERLLREGEEIEDDILRGASPSQAIFWGCGTLGSEMHIMPGNIVAVDRALDWDQVSDVSLDAHRGSPWFNTYIEFIDELVQRSRGRFPVSHGTLVGPLDYAVSLRGHEQTAVDLMLDPDKAFDLLLRLADFFIQITQEAWNRIPLFHGGYYDAQYQLWSPGSIVRLQEDAVAVISPDLYRKYLSQVDRRVACQFENTFMHLHATSMFILDQLLEIEEIRAFEINNDVGGPPVKEMLPYFQMVQKAGRPLLIRGSFTEDELKLLMDSLDSAGLYLYIMVADGEEISRLKPIVGM
ncbi:hypothetical protein B4O97_18135 [Marispirochaeta aestuarii]|uniref:Uroporphyrinogen decarboxylase (URO-D) domain-containing protein n=1 Tax=Marispirochaeta aestuarii TaxID=1963862 RepID=A0A1Y1RTC6_9SPIO|nr:hypothetical protein [Marispirochaeta aestuarii]ORC30337.1 hypothetical protein B4O97_18135 [Marispirochaeta aestuarii]